VRGALSNECPYRDLIDPDRPIFSMSDNACFQQLSASTTKGE
jgi:hypothetical protein